MLKQLDEYFLHSSTSGQRSLIDVNVADASEPAGIATFDLSLLSPASHCSNAYAASSDGIAPYISASGRCYFRSSSSVTDCATSYSSKSRMCLCSSPCLEGYYGMLTQCSRCPTRRRRLQARPLIPAASVRLASIS